MKKIRTVLCLFLAAALLFAACSQDSDDNGGGTTAGSGTASGKITLPIPDSTPSTRSADDTKEGFSVEMTFSLSGGICRVKLTLGGKNYNLLRTSPEGNDTFAGTWELEDGNTVITLRFTPAGNYTLSYSLEYISIESSEQLQKIGGEYPLNGKYTLTSDITLSNWTPIGGQQPFTGTFDGGEHTITLSGFNPAAFSTGFVYPYDVWDPDYSPVWLVPVGLFGHTDGAVVKDFTLQINAGSISLPATKPGIDYIMYCAAGIAGLAENTTLENITVGGAMPIGTSGPTAEVDAGGLAGWLLGPNSKILNCVSNAAITVTGGSAGGLVGEIAFGGTIGGCRATGNISSSSLADSPRAGGIAGKNRNGCTITQSSFSSPGTVSAMGTGDGSMAGGIVGENEHGGAVITYCFATGSVSASGSGDTVYAGGLIGANRTDTAGTVSHCYATGNVSANCSGSDQSVAGGLMGGNNPHTSSISVSYSYASGTVSATGDGSNSAAGISPHNSGATSIISCVALNPSVPAGNRIGSAATLTNNYGLQTMSGGSWSNNTSGSDGADVTAVDAQTQTWWTSVANWNFGNSESAPWVWDSGNNRPKLWWE